MSEALFRRILDVVVRLFLARSEDVLKAAQASPQSTVASVADALWDVMVDARRLSWAAAVLFLRGQGRKHGADEVWVPGIPGYSKTAVRDAVREAGASRLTPESIKRLQTVLTRHVEAAARKTVSDAVDDAPGDTELLDDPASLEDNLKGFSQKTRDQIVNEVRREQSRKRPRRGLDEVFNEIAERVDRAIDEFEAEDIARKAKAESAEGLDRVPLADRLDSSGKVIARPFAFARVVHPSKNGPCGFCAMLASRGPVYKSSRTAGQTANRFHHSCRCTVVPVFTSRRWPGKEQQQKFERVYNGVVRDHDLHGAEARRAMDRYQYHQRKESR